MLSRLLTRFGYRAPAWGDWQGAGDESAHYAALARLVQTYAPDQPVLDVGCGSAPLAAYLTQPYLGIDVNPHVLRAVRPGVRVRCVDAGTDPRTLGSFGCVVFCEMLYYLPTARHALDLIASYQTISPVQIVSIFVDPQKPERRNAAVWSALLDAYVPIAQVFIPQTDRAGWHLAVLH